MTDIIDLIRDLLTRGNDVRSWPADEQELHRNWTGGFTARTAALAELRAQKILAAVQSQTSTTGTQLIAAERVRHVTDEGYTAERDRGRSHELLAAAECYLLVGMGSPEGWVHPDGSYAPPGGYPWDEEFWKPSEDRVRNLTIAGSLIAAAIDELKHSGYTP